MLTSTPMIEIEPAIDSRPAPSTHGGGPALWAGPPADQDSLFDVDAADPDLLRPRPPRRLPSGVVHLVRPPGSPVPSPGLPDLARWCRTLTPALVEVLQRRRPLSQLEPWLDDPLLAALGVSLRIRHRARLPLPAAAEVRSVRAQCPTTRTVEVSAVLAQSATVSALAYRLVGRPSPSGRRTGQWLCVALDLGDQRLLGQRP